MRGAVVRALIVVAVVLSGASIGGTAAQAGTPSAPAAAPATPTRSAFVWGGDLEHDGPQARGVDVSALGGAEVTAASMVDASLSSTEACVVAGGRVFCYESSGGLPTGFEAEPSGVLAGRTVTDIDVADGGNRCAVASRRAFCWGPSAVHLGRGGGPATAAPVAVDTSGALAGKAVTDVAVGPQRACAVADGRAYCWGRQTGGALGNGVDSDDIADRPQPVDTSGVLAGRTVTQVATASGATCALADGAVFCWGYGDGLMGSAQNPFGQFPRPVAVDNARFGAPVTALSGGGATLCAIAGGRAFCWGSNGSGALGISWNYEPSTVPYPVPVDDTGVLAGKQVTALDTGGNRSCVIASGATYCWGYNGEGALGLGYATAGSRKPVAVNPGGALTGRSIRAVVTGGPETMAFTDLDAGCHTTCLPGTFRAVDPTRILDTRSGLGAPAGPVTAGGVVHLTVLGADRVPRAGLSAVVVNLTATGSRSTGYVTAWPTGLAMPGTSTLNLVPGQDRSSLTTVRLGVNGQIDLRNMGNGGSTHLVVDIVGWYLDGAAVSGGTYTPVDPQRVLDTRSGLTSRGPVTDAQVVAVPVLGRAGVPGTGVGAVVLAVTVTGPTRAGYVSAYPGATEVPPAYGYRETSALNFRAGDDLANLVTVPVGPDGTVVLRPATNGGTTQLVADVAGWYRSGPATAEGAFTPLTSIRVLDTRTGAPPPHVGALSPSTPVSLEIGTGRSWTNPVPVDSIDMAAVVANLTGTRPTNTGYVSTNTFTEAPSTSSALNLQPGRDTANATILPTAGWRFVDLRAGLSDGGGSTDVLVDVSGYFRSRSVTSAG